MIHLKLFEELNQVKPQIGDWVLCESNMNFEWNNRIGQIVEIESKYLIDFHNSPLLRWISKEYIKYWSKDIEELEVILNSKKYNL